MKRDTPPTIISVSIDTTTGKRTALNISGSAAGVAKALSFWAALPTTCPTCGAEIDFTFRSPGDNEYYGMLCTGSPTHEMTFHQRRDEDGSFYLKDEEMNKPWPKAHPSAQRPASKPTVVPYPKTEPATSAPVALGGPVPERKAAKPSAAENGRKSLEDPVIKLYNQLLELNVEPVMTQIEIDKIGNFNPTQLSIFRTKLSNQYQSARSAK